MKIAVIAVRTLMGLLFLFASITFLLKLFPQPELNGDCFSIMKKGPAPPGRHRPSFFWC